MGAPLLYWSQLPLDTVATTSFAAAGTTSIDNTIVLNDTSMFQPEEPFGWTIYYYDALVPVKANRFLLVVGGVVDDDLRITLTTSIDGVTYTNIGINATFLEFNNGIAYLPMALAGDVPVENRYWKLEIFSAIRAKWFFYHMALDYQREYPYLAQDPDETNITSTVDNLISQTGLFMGATQSKKEHVMSLDWGDLTASELVEPEAFAKDFINNPRQFFFIPDSDVTENIYYGYLKNGGVWLSKFTRELYTTPENKFISRIK